VKKIFLILLLFILTSFSGQVATVIHKDWKIENNGQWASFYWKVDRTAVPYNGTYWYYIYFYSNSFFATQEKQNGTYDKAITYIKNVKIAMYEYNNGKMYNYIVINIPVILCDYETGKYGAWFSSYSNQNTFYLNFEQVTAYDYSNK